MSMVVWPPKPGSTAPVRTGVVPAMPVMMTVPLGADAKAPADAAVTLAAAAEVSCASDAVPTAGKPAASNGPSLAPGEGDGAANIATRTYRFIMAGGGTGGHLYPGLAVAEALERELGDRVELVWAATPRAVDQRLLTRFGNHYVAQPVQPLLRKVSALWPFWKAWRQSCAFWEDRFRREHVDAVLALGGYAAGPAAHVASRLGIPVALLNPDAVPGLANRFLLKRTAVVFTQWDLPGHLATRIRGRVRPLGCPIRMELTQRMREDGAQRLGLDPARPTLLVTGGSLAARTINEAIVMLLADDEMRRALAGWQVLHLAGADFAARVKAAAEPIQQVDYRIVDYCDDMASVYAAGDLAVARAGASTCAELTACGVPSVLLPYPYHRDQHQRHNAQKLVDAGCAVLLADTKEAATNAAGLKRVLQPLLRDAQMRATMADRARQHGKPDAAMAIAQELVSLSHGR